MSMSNPQQSVSFTSNDLLHAKAHPVTCARRRQLSVFRAGGGHGNSGSPRRTLLMRRALAAFGAILALSAPGSAHDYWADGKAIPNWVTASCCGPADAHHLRPDQVRRVSDDYYEVDGYPHRVPVSRALPSQDADYWIFYRDDPSGQSGFTASSFRWTSDARPSAPTDRDGVSQAGRWETYSPRESHAERLA